VKFEFNLLKYKINHSITIPLPWVAAMQIQFHVCDLKQIFRGTRQEWTKEYLKHFVLQATKRSSDMITKFVKPFEKYIK
jgi:type II restriction enzyme